MKTLVFFLFCIVLQTTAGGQELFYWDSLNPTTRVEGDQIEIIFKKRGKLVNGKEYHINENDTISLKRVINDSVQVIRNNQVLFAVQLIENQLNLEIDSGPKNFQFIAPDTSNKNIDPERINAYLTDTSPGVYYDALRLSQLVKERDKNQCEINIILSKYQFAGGNKLINELYIDTFCESFDNDTAQLSRSAADAKRESIFTAIGGLDVTRYADGLAKFLVERAKKELSIAFFSKFKNDLDALTDIKTIFPSTSATLSVIENEIYNYGRYLIVLRESFESDFKALPENFTGIIQNNTAYFDQNQHVKSAILVSSRLTGGLRDKEHPGKILASIDNSYLEGLSQEINQSFTIIQVLSEALREDPKTDSLTYWVEKQKIMDLTKDSVFLKIFTGLLLERMREKDSELYARLNHSDLPGKVIPLIHEITTQTQRISNVIGGYQNTEKLSFDVISNYFDVVTKLFITIHKSHEILNVNSDKKDLDDFINFIKYANLLLSNIAKENYGSSIINTVELYKLALNNDKQETIKFLLKYGTFMAAMIDATSSDDVAKTIETFSMPAGSYHVKRKSKCNVALNAYLGGFMGWDNTDSYVGGIAAPVGLAFSHEGKCGSIGFFASLIDIGTISAFRFSNDSAQVAKIYLKEIISPGAFISYGFRNSPISINCGVQSAPLLQRVDPTTNEVDLYRNIRFSASILVDIPLLNFYNK